VTAAVSAGFFLRAWREVVPFTLALAGTAQLHDFGAVMLHLPGTAKSYAVEAPVVFWTVGPLLWLAPWGLVLSVHLGVRRWFSFGTRPV